MSLTDKWIVLYCSKVRLPRQIMKNLSKSVDSFAFSPACLLMVIEDSYLRR